MRGVLWNARQQKLIVKERIETSKQRRKKKHESPPGVAEDIEVEEDIEAEEGTKRRAHAM